MKARIRRKIHKQFFVALGLRPGYFHSSAKTRKGILRDLDRQLGGGLEYAYSRYCR